MFTKPNPTAPDAQAQIRRRNAFKRACERSLEIPGVREFESLVRDLFDPQTGVSTKRPGKDRHWFDNTKGFPTPVRLRQHVEHKESLAVTWGPRARVRIIDADAHGKSSPLDALPTLWDAIRALHIGRGGWLGPLVDGAIPDGAQLDGSIITSPNGLHYLEVTEAPWSGDTLRDDVARVTACLREQCVEVRPGVIEVLPSSNGQSRLPLGHGCAFVYPARGGVVDVETGLSILRSLRPVPRTFDALGEGHRREDFERVETVEIVEEPSWIESFGDAEPLPTLDVTTPPKQGTSWRKLRSIRPREPLYEGRGSSGRCRSWSGKSPFVERMEQVISEGASTGLRNRQLWDLCILHRLTWGGSREEVEDRITAWFETAPHSSNDLSNLTHSKRRSARRLLHRHLDRIDRGLVTGRFYQLGARKTDGPSRDALLLVAGTPEEASELVALGQDYLRDTTLINGLPAWMQSVLPKLVGAVVKWTRRGRIVLPTSTLEFYAGTKASRTCPFTGERRASYRLLLEALQRFGVIGGVVVGAVHGKRLASVYESNVGQDVKPVVVVAAWPQHHNVKRAEAPWKRAPFVVRRWVEVAGESSPKVALCARPVDVVERGPPQSTSHFNANAPWGHDMSAEFVSRIAERAGERVSVSRDL